MSFRFPYTNFHALNLDWFISQWNKFLATIDDRIASVAGITADADSVPYTTPASVDVTGGSGTADPYHMQFHIPRGIPVTVSSTVTSYASGDSATTPPSAESFQSTVPFVAGGSYLWTRVNTIFSDGTVSTAYMTARQGIDGMGAVDSVNDQTGAVVLTGDDIAFSAELSTPVSTVVDSIDSDLTALGGRMDNAESDIEDAHNDITAVANRVTATEGDIHNLENATAYENVTGYTVNSEVCTAKAGMTIKRFGKIVCVYCDVNITITPNAWTYYTLISNLPKAIAPMAHSLIFPKMGFLQITNNGELRFQFHSGSDSPTGSFSQFIIYMTNE